jgi:hypothetical protein
MCRLRALCLLGLVAYSLGHLAVLVKLLSAALGGMFASATQRWLLAARFRPGAYGSGLTSQPSCAPCYGLGATLYWLAGCTPSCIFLHRLSRPLRFLSACVAGYFTVCCQTSKLTQHISWVVRHLSCCCGHANQVGGTASAMP